MKKKISRKEMEDILHDEEVEARWKSIRGSETIRKAEEDEKFWREHLDPFYDEMFPHTPAKSVSDVVNKEIEEYEENDPIFKEFDVIEAVNIIRIADMGLLIIGIGLFFFIWLVMVALSPEESCLSC